MNNKRGDILNSRIILSLYLCLSLSLCTVITNIPIQINYALFTVNVVKERIYGRYGSWLPPPMLGSILDKGRRGHIKINLLLQRHTNASDGALDLQRRPFFFLYYLPHLPFPSHNLSGPGKTKLHQKHRQLSACSWNYGISLP